MTAREQMELNTNLASLGIPPLKMPAIAIAVVYNEDVPGEATQGEPIQNLSNSEEGNAKEDTPAQNATGGAEIEEEAEVVDVLNNLGAPPLNATPVNI